MHSKRLHLLLPFAVPSATHTADLLRDLELGGLEKLLQRASLSEHARGADFQRTLPHERWLTRRFGAGAAQQADLAPLAPYMLLADGGQPGAAMWACIEPVHIQIARDHLVLVDPASLALARADAAQLLEAARPTLAEAGLQVQAPDPLRWYVSGGALGTVAAASPLRASGRSIEIWLPHDMQAGVAAADAGSSQARRSTYWMKLQNEVQMAWFEHAVNEAREARGLQTANSIWLYGQGTLGPAASPYTEVYSASPATRGLALACGTQPGEVPASWAALAAHERTGAGAPQRAHASPGAPPAALIELDMLTLPFLHEDWYTWRETLAALERDWFAPALAALQAGQLDAVALTLCSENASYTLNTTRSELRKFWRRRTYASLASA